MSISQYSRHVLTWLALCFTTTLLVADDVIGWRGDGGGRYPDAKPPKSWSAGTNVLWKSDSPGGGYSSPVLVGKSLLLTVEPFHLVCLDADEGGIVWQQTASYGDILSSGEVAAIESTYENIEEQRRAIKKRQDALDKDKPDPKEVEEIMAAQAAVEEQRREFSRRFPQERRGVGNASATPACDGERVFIVLNTGIIAAFDVRDGRRLWIKRGEVSHLGFGHSSSPVLAGGKLLVHVQDLVALDPATGNELWRANVPAKHGTAAVTQIGGEEVLITPSGALVKATDGRVLAEKLFDLSENSPLLHDGVVYAHESGKTKAIRLPTSLDGPIEKKPLWESTSTREQRMASAVWSDGLLYCGTRSGIMDVVDAETGKSVYRKRLDLGELFASMVQAGDSIYVSGKSGKTLLLRPGREFEEVAINELGRTSSTPIFAGRRMYVRAEKSVYCVQE